MKNRILTQLQNTVFRNYHGGVLKEFSFQDNRIISPYFWIEYSGAAAAGNNYNINMEGFYKRVSNNIYNEIEFPGVEEIKENIKRIAGKKYSINIQYTNNYYAVNARYFYLIMELLKAENVYYAGPYEPLFIHGKKGKAFLLPINKSPYTPLGFSAIA